MFNKEKTTDLHIQNIVREQKTNRIFPYLPNTILIACYTAILIIGSLSITLHDNYNYPHDHRTRQIMSDIFFDIAPIKNMLEDNLNNHGKFMHDSKNINKNKLIINVTKTDHNFTKCEITANRLHVITYELSSYKSCIQAAYYFNGLLFQEEQKYIQSKKFVAQNIQ